MTFERRIPVRSQRRVIVDNDFAGDPDGLLALAHHLLANAATVVAVTTNALPDPMFPPVARNAARVLASDLVRRLGLDEPPVSDDTVQRFAELSTLPHAAELILTESRRDDRRPLAISCGGPLTNIAAALREDPELAERAEIIWIGGGAFPDGAWEYNLHLDLAAAQFVFNESRARLTVVPQPTYRQCAMSLAEFEDGMRAAGEFGAWLYDCFTSPPDFIEIGGVWPMGDSPPVLLTALTTESSTLRETTAPWIDDDGLYREHPHPRPLTVLEQVDVRLLFADFFARMRLRAS